MIPSTIRIARPTNSIAAMKTFYVDHLGLSVLGSFSNHAGFDGIMLGNPEYSWHLEFTHEKGVTVEFAPTKEHLLVFYFQEEAERDPVVKKLADAGHGNVQSHNPYWDPPMAITFEDPEGWRVVLCVSGGP